jgi:hypothetical protein
LILRGGEPVLDIISIISKVPREEIDELDLLDQAKLIGAAWEVNKRFFVRNQTELKEALGEIWTMIETVIAKLSPEKKSTPEESSPDSSTSSLPEATEPSSKS